MNRLNPIRLLFPKIYASAIFWTSLFSGVRSAFGLLLLPLILFFLTEEDLGMYYIFLSLVALVPLIENTFSFNIGRHVHYAMGGATRLSAFGADTSETLGEPNYRLLQGLLNTSGIIYGGLALLVCLLLGTYGTWLTAEQAGETSRPLLTWTAWWMMLAATSLDIFSLRWMGFLRNLNQVAEASRIGVASYAIKATATSVLLVCGANLLSIPLGTIVSALFQRTLARRKTLALLPDVGDSGADFPIRTLLKIIWPNTWRTGLKLFSIYLCNLGLITLCSRNFGLAAAAIYGLSVQIMNIAQQMAMVWTNVKWPLVGQLRIKQDYQALRKVLWPRLWLQDLTFVGIATSAIFLAQPLLELMHTTKSVLPAPWFPLLAINHFLWLRYAFWVFLISTENRLPSLWPTVITNLITLIVAKIFIQDSHFEIGSLVLAPLICGGLFNYWYWMIEGAKTLDTNWRRFLISPSAKTVL